MFFRHALDYHCQEYRRQTHNVTVFAKTQSQREEARRKRRKRRKQIRRRQKRCSWIITNGLFHARSAALMRRRYSVWRSSWKSSWYRLSADSWYRMLPAADLSRSFFARARGNPKPPPTPIVSEIGRTCAPLYAKSIGFMPCVLLRFVIPRGWIPREVSFPLIEPCRMPHANTEISHAGSRGLKPALPSNSPFS